MDIYTIKFIQEWILIDGRVFFFKLCSFYFVLFSLYFLKLFMSNKFSQNKKRCSIKEDLKKIH